MCPGGRDAVQFQRVRAFVRSWPLVLLIAGCAGRGAGPSAPAAPSTTAPDDSSLRPPPLVATEPPAGGPGDPHDPNAARAELRRSIFVAAWTLVRDKHYDRTLGGLDWNALRAKYEPMAVGAPDDPTFYRLVNEMLGALGQSHLEVTGPGAHVPSPIEDVLSKATTPRSGEPSQPVTLDFSTVGDPGVVVRVIDGRATITTVRPDSSAARLGLQAGFLVTHIGGHNLGTTAQPRAARALRPVEERYRVRLAAARLLSGPVGSRVTLGYLDHQDRPGEVLLTRDPPRIKPVQIGLLPPLYPEVRVSHIGDVGVIAFNFFLLDPVLSDVQKAIDGFRARNAKALILDLRGNPGGVGAMAIPVAARLVTKSTVLGTIQFREYGNTLTAAPSLGVKPFTGRLVILTDEGTASTSEMLAAGLQEAKRAVIVGDTTLGAVLPSAIERLPGGAVIQYVVADFRTSGGTLIEGRGVQPDRRVIETRAALRSGRDPVLDAGLVAARASSR